MRVVDKMEAIIRESVKPMERIESIKIMQLDGFAGVGGGGGADQGHGGITDNVVNSALRYRAQAPIVDQLLREIGLDAKDLTYGAASALPPASNERAPKDQERS
jgi:uncharacterized membrane protein YqiK